MSDELVVIHDTQRHQFGVELGGHCAYLAYVDLGRQTLDMYHTFVPCNLRGRGIAALLTQAALDYAQGMEYSVIPSCSYVARYMQRLQRNVASGR